MTSPSRRRRLTTTLTVVLAIAVVGFWAVTALGRDDTGSDVASDATTATTPGPTGATATPSPAALSNAAPTTTGVYGVPTTGAIPTSTPSDVATDEPEGLSPGARVVISYAAWSSSSSSIDVSAYVAGVVEDVGTCTVTVSQGAESATATAPTIPDATTTLCGDMSVSWSAVSGEAVVAVQYASATGRADAEPVSVEVTG